MLARIMGKYKVGGFVLLSLFMFSIPRPAAAQAAKTDEGQKIFTQNCASCHGPDGSASTSIGKAVGAKDLRSAEAQKLTDAEITAQISQGKGNMPPFAGTLSKAQIESLIPYLRELSKKPAGGKKPS